jgi:hypothetical protein
MAAINQTWNYCHLVKDRMEQTGMRWRIAGISHEELLRYQREGLLSED